MVVDASNVWDHILGRITVIPFPSHPTFVPSATFRTMGRHWAMSRCTKEGTVLIARVRSGANDTGFFFGPFGVATRRTCARPCRNWLIIRDEELVRWMGLKAFGRSITNFARVATPLWPSVGVKPNTWKSWRLGVFRDSPNV
jgi:hypothetical protein